MHQESRTLLVVAAEAEAKAVARGLEVRQAEALEPWTLHRVSERFDLLITGVGKANAAGAVARSFDPPVHAVVINLGVGGALPGSDLAPGDAVLATRSLDADEGLEVPEGFTRTAEMGFPPALGGDAVEPEADLFQALRPLADRQGPIATVSTCAGTDRRASAVVERTGALVEAMEGAAVGFTLRRIGAHEASGETAARFAELRVVSNTTGDRDRQIWRLTDALARLAEIATSMPRCRDAAMP